MLRQRHRAFEPVACHVAPTELGKHDFGHEYVELLLHVVFHAWVHLAVAINDDDDCNVAPRQTEAHLLDIFCDTLQGPLEFVRMLLQPQPSQLAHIGALSVTTHVVHGDADKHLDIAFVFPAEPRRVEPVKLDAGTLRCSTLDSSQLFRWGLIF